jgi:hypothetical protein
LPEYTSPTVKVSSSLLTRAVSENPDYQIIRPDIGVSGKIIQEKIKKSKIHGSA